MTTKTTEPFDKIANDAAIKIVDLFKLKFVDQLVIYQIVLKAMREYRP